MTKVRLKTKLISNILAKKCFSRNWFASKLKISSGYMSQLMNGTRLPSPKLRRKMLDEFPEYSFDDFFIVL